MEEPKARRRLRSIVTGGSGVLGAEIISALRSRGDEVTCLDLERPSDDDIPFLQTDLESDESVAASMEEVKRSKGGLDVLIHAAGLIKTAPFLEMETDDLKRLLDVNLVGAYRVAKLAADMMLDQGGRILFITSIHGQIGVPGRAAYAASKGGLASMARVMAAELARYKIRVNVLAPGAVDGGMMPDPTTRTGWVSATPSQRVAEVEEVARVSSMLTSNYSSFINGQVIALDGGVSTLRILE